MENGVRGDSGEGGTEVTDEAEDERERDESDESEEEKEEDSDDDDMRELRRWRGVGLGRLAEEGLGGLALAEIEGVADLPLPLPLQAGVPAVPTAIARLSTTLASADCRSHWPS